MHHALEIQEILSNIFPHCYSRDMATLARTCRAFKEPALDVLWKELDNLAPVAQCLPEVSRQLSTDEYSFSRPLTQTEWDILPDYTRRVRSLIVFRSGLDPESIRILTHPPTTESIFPNLRYLHCECGATAMQLLRLPLPSLISLVVNLENPQSWFSLESLPEFSPNIRCFFLYVDERDDAISKSVSKCVCRWRNLQTLVCPEISLDMDAIVHLSRMHALTRLECVLDSSWMAPDSPLSFPNLQDMTLRSESLKPISRLLSWTRLPIITDFNAFINTCPSRQGLSSFVVGIQTSCIGRTIQGLQLTQSAPSSDGRHPEAPLLGLEDLRPCTTFSNLRRIGFNIGWNVSLADNDLLALASAWPLLEDLVINTDWGWNTPGGITPSGLLRLLHTCRSLSHIALAMDTHGHTEFPSLLQSPKWTLPRTLSIDVLDSILEAETVPAVSAYFSSIASRSHLSLSAWDSWAMMDLPNMKVYMHRWADVHRRVDDALNLRSSVTFGYHFSILTIFESYNLNRSDNTYQATTK